jgi:hypothetical protein
LINAEKCSPEEKNPVVRPDLVIRDDIPDLNPDILDRAEHRVPTLPM